MKSALIAAALLLGAPASAAAAANDQTPLMARVQQIRIYEIFEHNKAAFHARFRDHAVRIMRRHGFEILAMWEASNGGRTEFVYLLDWPDEITMNQRWKAFMADDEWSAIKKATAAQHGSLVGEIQSRTLKPTTYSPATGKQRPKGETS